MIPYRRTRHLRQREDVLRPEYVTGDNYRLFSTLEFPWDRDYPDGWRRIASRSLTVTRRRARIHERSNPKFTTLRAALAVPLVGVRSGVLACSRSITPSATPSPKTICEF